jgi:hypothetical protein
MTAAQASPRNTRPLQDIAAVTLARELRDLAVAQR